MDKDLSFGEMFAMQTQLQEAHPQWGGYYPNRGKESLLWAFEEMGEVVSIFKKKGPDAILSDPEVRGCFLEETNDVLMYLIDMCQCLSVTPEELGEAFRRKWSYNMHRDWVSQNAQLFTHSHLSADLPEPSAEKEH
jgi:NTP pyrophosphatase (non-canonical NTP hydrolase)